MRTIKLNKCGTVECLLCFSKIKYPARPYNSCECNNISVKEYLLYDKLGTHMYSVKPEYLIMVAKNTIITDFDRTLTIGNDYPFIGKPNNRLVQHLIRMIDTGINVLVYTTRTNPLIVGGREEVKWHKIQIRAWLDKHGLKAAIISNSRKPYGYIMWDDKAVSPIGNKCLEFLI